MDIFEEPHNLQFSLQLSDDDEVHASFASGIVDQAAMKLDKDTRVYSDVRFNSVNMAQIYEKEKIVIVRAEPTSVKLAFFKLMDIAGGGYIYAEVTSLF